MQLYTIGVNHHTAPLSVREQVAFPGDGVGTALQDLVHHRPVNEAAIVSTCNRTELYCNTDEPKAAIDWLAEYHRLSAHSLQPYVYALPTEGAVKHAFRVASGLDSMVIGEPQILGQFKQAVKAAEQAGTLGVLLHKLFQRTFSVAKEVRTHTEIGASAVSMASCAVHLAERIYPSIAEQSVLFVGAGEMIELCAAHFCAARPHRVTFANRTIDRAEELGRRYGAATITLSELVEHLPAHDVVVTCTASPLPIIGKGTVERSLKARRRRPMFIVDLAVPRDVEPEVAELDDVFLYTVDDLGRVAQAGECSRQAAVAQAEAIIDHKVQDFLHWLENRETVPSIRALRDQAERARRHEMERALRRLTRGDDPEQVLDHLSRALTNKLLHAPTHALGSAEAEDRRQLLAILSRLYNIHHHE
jgi:glutamyl-tRNA reductase